MIWTQNRSGTSWHHANEGDFSINRQNACGKPVTNITANHIAFIRSYGTFMDTAFSYRETGFSSLRATFVYLDQSEYFHIVKHSIFTLSQSLLKCREPIMIHYYGTDADAHADTDIDINTDANANADAHAHADADAHADTDIVVCLDWRLVLV
jgi:hypothetical protein